MQSHNTLPRGMRRSSARWPMEKVGCEPIPVTPGSYSRQALMWSCRSTSSVVQVCPRGGTYCRSSSQILHSAGGCVLFAYCVPQAVQMKLGIRFTCFVVAHRILEFINPRFAMLWAVSTSD